MAECNNSSTESSSFANGRYIIVSIDIDATGRRLTDEMVQLSAYTPNLQYSEYIMPYMDLSAAARQRHQVQTVSIGKYRELKCLINQKTIPALSEYHALQEFLDWLEFVIKNNPDSDGIILFYYEKQKFLPYILIKAMKRYDLLDRFLKSVKGFANGFEFTKSQSKNSIAKFLLAQLKIIRKTTVVQETNDEKAVTRASQYSDKCRSKNFDGRASIRAKIAYNIAQLLSKMYRKANLDQVKTDNYDALIQSVIKYAQSVTVELSELENNKIRYQIMTRRHFFKNFNSNLWEQEKVINFWIILTENGYDLEALKNIWTVNRRQGISEIIETIDELRDDEKFELIDLIDGLFNRIKETIEPTMNPKMEDQQPAADTNQEAGDKCVPDSK